MNTTPTVADLVAEEERIDKLRLKAFKTNSPEDRQAYFNATSKWFQDRHYRRLNAALPPAATEPVAWEWRHPRATGGEWCHLPDYENRANRPESEYRPLYAAPPSPVTEPVAYLHSRDDGSLELVLAERVNSDTARRRIELGWKSTPLYAAPPSPVTVEAAEIPAEDRIRIARKILNQTERKHADRVNAALRVLAGEKS